MNAPTASDPAPRASVLGAAGLALLLLAAPAFAQGDTPEGDGTAVVTLADGSRRTYAADCAGGEPCARLYRLDGTLVTRLGAITQLGVDLPREQDSLVLLVLPDGRELLVDAPAQASPDGAWLAVTGPEGLRLIAVADPARVTGLVWRAPAETGLVRIDGWDATTATLTILALDAETEGPARLTQTPDGSWTVTPTGGAAEPLAPQDPFAASQALASDRRVPLSPARP